VPTNTLQYVAPNTTTGNNGYTAGTPVCWEIAGSRKTNADAVYTVIDTLWVVEGTDDELDARNLVGNAADPTYYDSITARTLIRKSVDVEDIGPAIWLVTVHYGVADRLDPNLPQSLTAFSFDTTGGTQRVKQSKGTQSYGCSAFGPGIGLILPAPNFGSAIGVTRDNVEGVDMVVPSLKFSQTIQWAAASITNAYVSQLVSLTGTTNAAPWGVYDTGQVLFLGASGQSQPDGIVPVTYHFEVGVNVTNATLGGATGVSKTAWQYLWTYHDINHDDNALCVTRNPRGCYVETLYDPGDFTQLGIQPPADANGTNNTGIPF
jgi:hypothetical protein